MTVSYRKLIAGALAPLAALATLALAPQSPILAQQVPGYGPAGAPPSALPPREGRAPAGRRIEIPTAEQLAGPPTPALLLQQFSLSEEQAARYTELYQTHIATTGPHRDSAFAAHQALQSAMHSRDQARVVTQAELLERLGRSLQKSDRGFEDKTLRPLLTKEQDKSYKQWRDAEQKRTKQERNKQAG